MTWHRFTFRLFSYFSTMRMGASLYVVPQECWCPQLLLVRGFGLGLRLITHTFSLLGSWKLMPWEKKKAFMMPTLCGTYFFAHFVNGHHMFINLFCGGLYNCPTYILFICLFYPINKRCIFYPINVYWLKKIYKHYFSFWPFVLVFLLTHFRFLQLCFHIVLERYFVLAYTYNQIYLAW